LAGLVGLAGHSNFLPMSNREAQPDFLQLPYPPATQPMAFASTAAPRSFLAAGTTD
jgi:hypothetical protein